MKKLEELIEKYGTYQSEIYENEHTEVMILGHVKQLIQEYVTLCLEKAAEEATLSFSGIDDEIETGLTGCSNDYGSYWINKQSITDIELP